MDETAEQPSPTQIPLSPTQIPLSPTATPLPIPAIQPQSIALSDQWRFSTDPDGVGESQGWYAPDFDDSSWASVNVPHTWNVMPEHWDYDGLAWYRRSISIPEGSDNGIVRLHFEAVFYLARVWLNGEYLGQHEGGYTPFEFDISTHARQGDLNILAVQVDNLRAYDRIPAVLKPGWSFDWWNYGGITRQVSLEVTSQAYIAHQRIVSSPHLTGMDQADSAILTATVEISNTSTLPLHGRLVADLVQEGSSNSPLSTPLSLPVQVPAGESAQFQLSAELANPALWHFDHPNLYLWSASLLAEDGQLLHTHAVTIGIRSVELKEGRFYLNGEPVRLVGVTRHADYPGQGAAETVTAMLSDYNDIKLLNEVLSRPVHYPQAQTILDFADRQGILLIPEVPAWQLTQFQMGSPKIRELEKSQLREMILADTNHPSVWAWSIGNEIESETSAGNDFVREMIAYVKSLDPTRPVGFASNRLNSNLTFEATAFSDFVLMNQYFGTWVGPKGGLGSALDRIHQTWPNKVVIISEYGFEPHWNALWGPSTASLSADEYYFIPDGTPSDAEVADEVRRQLISEQMDVFRSKPFIAGAIFWTYQDYRTPSNFVMGVVVADRNKRGSWQLLREEYAPALLDALTLSAGAAGELRATVALHTRGPVETDMPAYTLRGYSLFWKITSLDGSTVFFDGSLTLPDLAPASPWSGEFSFPQPNSEYLITLSIVRPTGFSVIDHTYDSHGALLP